VSVLKVYVWRDSTYFEKLYTYMYYLYMYVCMCIYIYIYIYIYCGAGEGWRSSVGPIMCEIKKYYLES